MKIKSKNTQYNGVSAGVRFANGIGETEDELKAEWLLSHGYEAEAEVKAEVKRKEGK